MHLGTILNATSVTGVFSLVFAIVTAIVGILAINNAVRLNKQKHHEIPASRRGGDHRTA